MGGIILDKKLMYFANMNTILYNLFNFHWNVTGGLFLTLHKLYQEQYEIMFLEIDRFAELLKTKDIYPLTCLQEIYEAASIKTMESKDWPAKKTLQILMEQYIHMNQLAIECAKVAEEKGELAFMDFFTEQSEFFGKYLYFFRQFLK